MEMKLLIAVTSLSLATAAYATMQTVPATGQAPTAAAAPAQAPLPPGARIAFVNLETVFAESEVGKQGQERFKQLTDKLTAGLTARDKEIQALAEKIQTQQALVTEAVWRQWGLDLGRLQREAQFAQQDAQAQSTQLQQDLLEDFEKQIQPVVDAMRVDLKLDAIFAVESQPGGLTLLSSDRGVDLSSEVVRRLAARK
jgi:Skp family chaperone for outer membrane proteins